MKPERKQDYSKTARKSESLDTKYKEMMGGWRLLQSTVVSVYSFVTQLIKGIILFFYIFTTFPVYSYTAQLLLLWPLTNLSLFFLRNVYFMSVSRCCHVVHHMCLLLFYSNSWGHKFTLNNRFIVSLKHKHIHRIPITM